MRVWCCVLCARDLCASQGFHEPLPMSSSSLSSSLRWSALKMLIRHSEMVCNDNTAHRGLGVTVSREGYCRHHTMNVHLWQHIKFHTIIVLCIILCWYNYYDRLKYQDRISTIDILAGSCDIVISLIIFKQAYKRFLYKKLVSKMCNVLNFLPRMFAVT